MSFVILILMETLNQAPKKKSRKEKKILHPKSTWQLGQIDRYGHNMRREIFERYNTNENVIYDEINNVEHVFGAC